MVGLWARQAAFIVAVAACAVGAIGGADAVAADRPEKPNILYIMADDLGYGDLSSYGQQMFDTPNIDRLAEQGMKFTDHYAGHTVCRPSRLVLWTGRHSGHTAISDNDFYQFENDETTVAELLQEAGYATGGIGKWAMGGVDTPGHPNRNGFDYWFGYLDQTRAHNFYPPYLWENEARYPLEGNVVMGDQLPHSLVAKPDHRETYAPDVMTEKALDWIREHAEGPFLFHAHYTIPHTNNQKGQVDGDGMEVPDYGPYADEDWPDVEKGFAAQIHRLDRDIGRLMDLLDELGIAENTLVIFTSDNGPHHEGGHDHRFFDSNGPLRGYKRDLYDGGIRVPFIARWPGTIEPGAVSDHPSAFYDFLPTAAELAGIDPPSDIDGLSYLPTLLGDSQQQATHRYLYWQFQGKRAVREGRWKAVRPDGNAPVELYDIEQDPGEQNDLASEHPDVLSRLKQHMEEAEGDGR